MIDEFMGGSRLFETVHSTLHVWFLSIWLMDDDDTSLSFHSYVQR